MLMGIAFPSGGRTTPGAYVTYIFVGFVFTDFYTLPGFEYSTLEAHDACVASGAMSQLLLWTGLLEVISLIGVDQMLRGYQAARLVTTVSIL